MKKMYLEPEVEIVELTMGAFLCTSGDPIQENGEVEPTPSNPSDDGWGDDY